MHRYSFAPGAARPDSHMLIRTLAITPFPCLYQLRFVGSVFDDTYCSPETMAELVAEPPLPPRAWCDVTSAPSSSESSSSSSSSSSPSSSSSASSSSRPSLPSPPPPFSPAVGCQLSAVRHFGLPHSRLKSLAQVTIMPGVTTLNLTGADLSSMGGLATRFPGVEILHVPDYWKQRQRHRRL